MTSLISLLTEQVGTRDDRNDDGEKNVPAGRYAFLTGDPWLAEADTEACNPLWKEGTPLFTAEDRDGVILTYLVEGDDFERVSVNLNFDHEAAPDWPWWERERFEAVAAVAFLDVLGRIDLDNAYAEFCAQHDTGADQATLSWSKAEDAAFAAAVQSYPWVPHNFTFNMAP